MRGGQNLIRVRGVKEWTSQRRPGAEEEHQSEEPKTTAQELS